MSETFFNKPPENPDKDTFYTMGALDNFANPPPENPSKDTNYTMGGLDTLPETPPVDLSNFIGSAAQLAQLYPGSQNRPQYTPGLTDLRFTRSFQGVSPTGGAYSPSGAGAAPGPDPNKIVYQQPLPQYETGNLDATLLSSLLGMDWSGAYQDYLDRLEAEAQDINISNVFTPTNTNVNQLSQSQYQIQGDGSSSDSQDQSDRFDSSDSLTDEALGGGLDDFFKYGPAALNAAEGAAAYAKASAEAERRREAAAAQAEAERQAAAAEAERQRIAAIQTKTAPVVNQATTKFQADVSKAVTQRDNIKKNLDAAIAQKASPEIIKELEAGYQTLDSALKDYDVTKIANDPAYASEQAQKLGAEALKAFSDPENLPPPEVVDQVLSNVINTVGADTIAESISEEGAAAILEAAGSEIGADALAGMGGDIAGPVAAALVSLASGESVGTAAAEAAKAYAVAQIAAIPVVGPYIAAAIVLDSVLSSALGYESPISDAVAGAGKNIDKAISWTGRSLGSDPIGGVVDWVGSSIGKDPVGAIGRAISNPISSIGRAISNPIRSIGRAFGFQEGGLVDLPGDSMYNDNSQGVLPDVEGYARGGIIPLPGGGKIAKGPGGGLDDLIPTTIDGRRAAALSDGEFVIPADVVSMMGDGSTNAGSKRLYDLVKQVRQHKTGTTRQAGPLQVGKILERTMK